ncbi:Aste57867_19341 [Aphanomyces stellatus]|uniref:Aste57867_19341 protein n=1 Tax=Aphanomyces stellatus TaxID=120398 RepID=A0A485LE80_9STRA|nr:hypothetical protein As57867_019277 [Aphanomyces stellatus]VFT96055.1 Aste57867_19341 [Aphanomyces stellatus]
MKYTASIVAFAVTAALSLFGGAVHAAPNGTCAAIEENTDYAGNDIKTTYRASADLCCGDCANTVGCTVYVWAPDGRCLLKSAAANKGTAAGARAAKLVLPAGTCAPTQANTDLPGNDLGDPIQADTTDLCCTACAANPACQAYVWVLRDNVGTCLLKNAKGSPSAYPGATAAFLSTSTPIVAPTPAPTPTNSSPSLQCAPVLENTDFPGNDLGNPLALATLDLCCSACSSTPGCAAFIWVMRDVGMCILKSVKGPAYPSPGARASYLVAPPTPSACPTVENDVDYAGNDIISVARANHADCCAVCQTTPGCSLYVWGAGTCYLKSKKGDKSAAPGARAAVLPVTVGSNTLTKVQSAVFGAYPFPQTAYSFVAGGQWIDQDTLAVVKAQVETFIATSLAANLSHGQAEVPMFTLEASLGINAYINVTSAGECAALTAAYKQNFFTYDPTNLYCLVNVNTPDSTLAMLSATGETTLFPQSLDDAYKGKTTANVVSTAACVKLCQAQVGCAGVVYAATSKSCTVYQPKASNFAKLSAGWVFQPVVAVDIGAVQFSSMAMATLPRAYIMDMLPGIASTAACATSSSQKKFTLFSYNSATKACNFYKPSTSSTKALSLVNTPVAPVALSGTFGTDVVSTAVTASTALDCSKLCLPSQKNCFASVFDASKKTCATLQAGFDAATTLGWIVPPTLLPTAMASVTQVDFYVTAHQDDHELFMSANVYDSLKTKTTKSVFVYMSSGDAGQTDGWYQARETGTLAATKTWINLFGLYAPTAKKETVTLSGHRLQKISIGNAVHYFFRLSEANLGSVLTANTPQAPMDQPGETYANADAVKAVLKAIVVAEATKVTKVTASFNEYLQNPGGDHVLHVATGRLTGELLSTDPLFSACVSQTPFFGYQHWLDTVNEKDPALTAQRAMWLQLGVGIYSQYTARNDLWSEHSPALGRVYPGSTKLQSTPCKF